MRMYCNRRSCHALYTTCVHNFDKIRFLPVSFWKPAFIYMVSSRSCSDSSATNLSAIDDEIVHHLWEGGGGRFRFLNTWVNRCRYPSLRYPSIFMSMFQCHISYGIWYGAEVWSAGNQICSEQTSFFGPTTWIGAVWSWSVVRRLTSSAFCEKQFWTRLINALSSLPTLRLSLRP